MAFAFSLFMLWQGWQRHEHPVVPPAAQSTASVAQVPAGQNGAVPVPTATTNNNSIPAVSNVPQAGQPAQAGLPKLEVSTDQFVAEISAGGGDLTRLELKHHHATIDKTKNFVLLEEKHAYAAQSGLIGAGLPNHKSVWTLPNGPIALKDGENELRVSLSAQGENGIQVTKTYIFQRGSYVVDLEYQISNNSPVNLNTHAYFQLTRDNKAPDGANSMMTTFTGPAFYTDSDKYLKSTFEEIANNKTKLPAKANNGWVAMVQHYFVSAWLPTGSHEREFFVREIGKDIYSAGVILPVPSLAPGASTKFDSRLYVGPQEQEKLAAIAPGFDLVVDYGWLTVIAAPIFWLLQWLHSFIGNWGWSIIVLTIIIKAAFFPLSAASYKSMAKMKLLTPKLTKLKETFGDNKQRLNQEMMELYKKEKVNPLGGCLPIMVQIPVFLALYWVLQSTVEMRGAPWLGWIKDLSAQDPYFVLPLIMGVTMVVTTKLNPTPPDPMQAKVMMIMPIVFTGMFLFFPAGLVLYWTVNNLLSIAQQWQVTRMIEASGIKAK